MQIIMRADRALILLSLEFLILFGGMPLFLLWLKDRSVMIAILWGAALAVWLWLRRTQRKTFRDEWNMAGLRAGLKTVLLRFAFIAPATLAFMWLVHPDRLFSFPLERFDRWATVMILYPILSVLPQEMIYKTLFFGRYARLFGQGYWFPLVASAMTFGYMHIMLGNIVAVAATALAGLLISHSYLKHRSLALASFEHALYGCWIFTVGMGIYFYTGAAWGTP